MNNNCTDINEHDLTQEKSYQEHSDQGGRKSSLTTRIKQYGVVLRAYLKQSWPILLVSFFTFINGVSSIALILVTRVPERAHFLLPFGLYHWTRSLTLVAGFVLIYLSYYLLKQRRVAWWIAVFAAGIETVTHLIHLHLWYNVLAPLITFILLIVFRHRFSAHSESRNIKLGIGLFLASILIALLYGTIGFWMLDKRDFGINFSLTNALVRTIKEFTLLGNSDLVAKSREASWFLRSLNIFGIVAGIFAMYSLFRPIISRLVEAPHERARAKQILNQHGRSAYDYFKVWPDKSYFFSESKRSFISYRCISGVAFCLGDPVGPEDETEFVIRGFLNLCYQNGWAALFLLPEQPALYRRLGLSLLKIGEEAVIDLEHFATHTAQVKYFRYVHRKLDGTGYRIEKHNTPVPSSVLDEAEKVSHKWLSLPRHREFGFLQGRFDRAYLKTTVIWALYDSSGKMVAFLNQVPSFKPGEANFDLMRHLPDLHWGAMDYLFQAMMINLQQEKFQTFNFGLAPFVGIGTRPDATLTEKAVNQLFERLDWFVHSRGMRQYKVKFEPMWIDRFVAYQGGPLGLLKMVLALNRVL